MTGIVVGVGPRGALGYEAITVSTVAIGPTSTKVEVFNSSTKNREEAIGATFSVEADSIRIRWDGTAPTASEGHLYTAGQTFDVWGKVNLQKMKMIRVTSDATVRVTYWGE